MARRVLHLNININIFAGLGWYYLFSVQPINIIRINTNLWKRAFCMADWFLFQKQFAVEPRQE